MQTHKMRKSNIRFLKVQSQTRLNVYSTPVVPSLTVRGEWLQRAGFEPGQRSRITVLNKILIIRVDDYAMGECEDI
jgi:hypothetical protein